MISYRDLKVLASIGNSVSKALSEAQFLKIKEEGILTSLLKFEYL